MIYECCFPRAHYPSLLSVQHPTKGAFAAAKQDLWLLLEADALLALGPKALQEAERMPSRVYANLVLKRKRHLQNEKLFAAAQNQTGKSGLVTFVTFLLVAQDRN